MARIAERTETSTAFADLREYIAWIEARGELRRDDIDRLRFPTPQWHEADGGRYIGTAALNIMQDPDEGWVNVGTYRSMIHDRNSLLLYISPGKHGRLIRHKYFERGQPCPVAIAVGQDPAVTLSAFYSAQWGVSEYDFAGWLRGAPV